MTVIIDKIDKKYRGTYLLDFFQKKVSTKCQICPEPNKSPGLNKRPAWNFSKI